MSARGEIPSTSIQVRKAAKMNFDLDEALKVLDIQRAIAVNFAQDCDVSIQPDVLWVFNNYKFDISATRQVSYYNGNANMLEAIIKNGNSKKYLRVKDNKHYVSDESE